MQHINKLLGYGPIISGTEDKCLERIKNSKFNPIIKKLLDGDEELDELKKELIEKNLVNYYRMSLKS